MKKKLSLKKCLPCEGIGEKLKDQEILVFLKQIKDWNYEQLLNPLIQKKFQFKDFISAMNFVNRMADLAEQEAHHPNFEVAYNQVQVKLWTHGA